MLNCKEIDLANLDTTDCTNTDFMFQYCSNLENLDLSNFSTTNLISMKNMFFKCTKLTSINLTNFNTNNVTNMYGLFSNCEQLTSIDISGFNTENVTDMGFMFSSCRKLESLDVSNFNTSKVENMECMFQSCVNLSIIDVSGFDTSAVTNMEHMFFDCSNVQLLDVSGFNTNNVTQFSGMFSGCKKLISADVSNFNTSNARRMSAMFSNCTSLSSIDVSGFDTSNVNSFRAMFQNYKGTILDVSRFNTSKATDMSFMFSNCSNLTTLDVSNFDTSNVNDFSSMFQNYKGTILDVSGFNTSKATDMSYMFFNCSNITTLDLSNFDTSNVNNMNNTFSNLNNLETINLGKNFSFDGKGGITYKGILPRPTGAEFTGKWIREDEAFGPYTPAELSDNYNGTTMEGIWIRERRPLTVTYEYDGYVPYGASTLPEARSYMAGEEVIVAQNATATGYTFSGWSRTGSFEMPTENVIIIGSFIANTDTPYKIEHYLEDLSGNSYSLGKVEYLTGETDSEVIADPKDFEGFEVDWTNGETLESGFIQADGSLVLKLYYKRNAYNVTYSYTGDIPNDASPLPQSKEYKYGAEINVAEDATADGYTFSGWIKDYITMPAQDVEIIGYFIENTKSYNYRIEYYFDGELDESLEEILNAEKDEEIAITPQTPLKHGERNYTLVSDKHKITISINEEENVINVYYETDVLDYEIDNSEDTTEGDGIPDKYQIKITYKVENGSWDDGTKETKTDVITLKDKNGNYAEDGEGELKVPQVGKKPAEGYKTGSWNKDIPSKVSKDNDGDEFIYSFKKNEIAKANISETDGKSSNPKTQDIMPLFLLIGTTGIAILIIAKNIRRKYSRKAKKIQF